MKKVELTGLWVHGVMERKEARVKLRIMTGREDAAEAHLRGEEHRGGELTWGRKGVG